ncbi:MAG: CidA/LrgA family protein [Tannerellaceae bacterium]
MLTEVFYIFLFYFAGEFISYWMDGFIPGCVVGMMLLFLALAFRLIEPARVRRISTLLTENMGLFFLPAGVGLMTSFAILSQNWAVILTASVVSTLLVIACVSLIQQKMGKENAHE